MGWFSNDEKKEDKYRGKNVEIITSMKTEKIEEEIEKRIAEGRIIKDIKITTQGSYIQTVLIMYDTWAERNKKEGQEHSCWSR